jgi:hypothetical protein
VNEAGQWQELQRQLRGRKDVHMGRVENPCDPGMPDVSWAWAGLEGFVELKDLNGWPKRGGPVRVRHFRPAQKIWLRRRTRAGGRCHVLIRIGNEWLLLPGAWAAAHLGNAPRTELERAAVGIWIRAPRIDDLLARLTT